jgi:outer membrane protein assembly factor BamB
MRRVQIALGLLGLVATLASGSLLHPRAEPTATPKPADVKLAWTKDIGAPIKSTIALVGVGFATNLAFTANKTLYVLNRDSGAELFHWDGAADLTPAVVADWDNAGFVGDAAGTITAFDIRSGNKTWTKTISGASFTTAPSITTDRSSRTLLIIADDNGAVYGIDGRNGTTVWTVKVADRPGTPAVSANFVIFTYYPWNYLINLDTSTGNLIWNFTTSNIQSVPVLLDDVLVFVGTGAGNFQAIYVPTGVQVWNQTTAVCSSKPYANNGVVIFGDVGGYVWSFDAFTGNTNWGAQTNATVNGIAATPAADDFSVYVPGTDGVVYALDKWSGNAQWAYATGSQIEKLQPTIDVANRRIFLGNDGGKANCLQY